MNQHKPLYPAPVSPDLRTVRVMLVDDSLVVRSILERIIDSRKGLKVVASLASAQDALVFLSNEPVDVVLLDIEMPGMNGMAALPHILELAEHSRVLILSSNCEAGGPAAIEALSLGASDTLAKPGRGSFSGRFAEILIERILALGHQQHGTRGAHASGPTPRYATAKTAIDFNGPLECIGVAASTGGIPAFSSFMTHLDPRVDAPILITQHLPDAFISHYARQIRTMTQRVVKVAESGMLIESRHIYLAPGDSHMRVIRYGHHVEIALDTRPAASGCCPSADPMLASIADCYGARSAAVILSGMGRDGADGAARLKVAGGMVFAQAPESCVVWGMPGAVSKSGISSATLNPDAIAVMLGMLANKARLRP
jgi:two-component system, chemotaxis family, protein-glutamate methylesterase/glutaminase